MAIPLSVKQNLVYVKSQAAVGTGATIAQASDKAVRVMTCEFTQAGEGLIERDDLTSATGLPASPKQGSKRWDIKITSEYLPFSSYTDIDSSPLSPLLKACGAVTAVTAVPGATADAIKLVFPALFNPPTAPVPCTIELHEIGGNVYRATDVIGTLLLKADTAGARIMFEFTLQGRWVEDPVASTFTAALADFGADPLPVTFCGATIVSGIRRTDGTTEQTITGLRSMGMTPGVAVTERPDATQLACSCFAMSYLTRTGGPDTVGFTCDEGAEGDTANDLSVWANWKASATGRDLSIILNTGSGGTRIQGFLPQVHYRTPVLNTANPFRAYDLTAFGVDQPTGATEGGLQLYFYAGA